MLCEAGGRTVVPVLWHLKVSNYNEKARWALDHKRVAHMRRAVEPGRHRAVARKLGAGSTFPVLVLDGEPIGDSTDIIAALERRHPEWPLYPEDPDERRRALELEDFFDEELGPYVRLLVVHHLLDDPEVLLRTFAPDMARMRRRLARGAFPLLRQRLQRDFGIDEAAVQHALQKLRAAGRRFRAELEPSGYLVGSRFSVADLTLAAMVAPAITPRQYPYPQAQCEHPRLAPVREALGASDLLAWALGMYSLHRGATAEVGPGQVPAATAAATARV
jgi:glutathione S-transferase